jgi:hypothetical protein
MDILSILGSINIISVFFFVLTFGVLIYEIYLFRKEKKKKEKPTIPNFNPTKAVPNQIYSSVPVAPAEKPKVIKKRKNLALMIGVAVATFFGIAIIIVLKNTAVPEKPPPPVNTIATSHPTKTPSPTTSDLFITPTSTPVILAQNLTPTASPSAIPLGGTGNVTSTPSATTIPTTTISPSPTSIGTATSSSLPVAGIVQPQLFILLLGAATVFISIVY